MGEASPSCDRMDDRAVHVGGSMEFRLTAGELACASQMAAGSKRAGVRMFAIAQLRLNRMCV